MMKKIFLMALAAITLTAFSSCDKSDDDNGGGGSSLPAAPYKGEGKTLKISSNNSGINQIRLMESGTFMIACKGGYASKMVLSRAGTRGENDIFYELANTTTAMVNTSLIMVWLYRTRRLETMSTLRLLGLTAPRFPPLAPSTPRPQCPLAR